MQEGKGTQEGRKLQEGEEGGADNDEKAAGKNKKCLQVPYALLESLDGYLPRPADILRVPGVGDGGDDDDEGAIPLLPDPRTQPRPGPGARPRPGAPPQKLRQPRPQQQP